MYDPSSPLAFRVLAVRDQRLDEQLIEGRLSRAVDLRRRLFDDALTTGVCNCCSVLGGSTSSSCCCCWAAAAAAATTTAAAAVA